MSDTRLDSNTKTDMIPALIGPNILARMKSKVQVTTQLTNYPCDNKGVSCPIKIPKLLFIKVQ